MSPNTPHDDQPRPSRLTERDIEMAHEIGRHASQHVVARLTDMAQDDEFIERVANKWSRKAEQIVGAAVIRFAFWVVGIVALVVAWKAGVVHAISDAIGTGGKQP